MVSDKFSTNVILFYSYKLFATDWNTGAKNWRILLNWEKYPKLSQLSAWKTGTICKCKLLSQISQTMQWHCSFMFLNWSFYFVRWNCHLVRYLSLQIMTRFLSKMQPRQDLWIISIFFDNLFQNAILYLMPPRHPLPATNWTRLTLRHFNILTTTRYSANLIKFDSSENSYCGDVSNGVTGLTAAPAVLQ